MRKMKQVKQLIPREVYELALEAAMGKLREATERISVIRAALSELNTPPVESPLVLNIVEVNRADRSGRGPMTPEGRARIAAAQKKRWAAARRAQKAAAKKDKRTGNAKLAKLAKKEKVA